MTKLADEASRRAFLFFWNESHPQTGLTKDRAKTLESFDEYTVASVAATGYALAALAIGAERGWKSKSEARARALLTLRFVHDKLKNVRGFHYHFVDWKTGARLWECELSSIDTSLLVLGALVAGSYFGGECQTLADAIHSRLDWRWMQNGDERSAPSMGWKPDSGFLGARWSGYSEALYLYLLGLSGNLPDAAWDAWNFPLTDNPTPIFWTQMWSGFFDLRKKKDSHGRDWRAGALSAHQQHVGFCKKHPKLYPNGLFGINACDQPPPVGYGAQEPAEGRHDSTIAPTAILAASAFVPEAAEKALKTLESYKNRAWGRYGFSNAINPSKGWFDRDTLGIDLGMALLLLENKRSGLIWKILESHPALRRGRLRAGFAP